MTDPRPRNNQGQFAPQEAGIDANTTSTAYNPQVIEQRKLSLIEKIRRMRGVRNEGSVPSIDSNVVNERIRRETGGRVLFSQFPTKTQLRELSEKSERNQLSAKLRLRELARQTYDPYAPQPAQAGQGAQDFRNAAIGIGALGAGAGVAYAGWRGAQAAQSAQTLTDDAMKTSAEARKAARAARVGVARVGRAGKVIKTQLTTFPTFKKARLAVAGLAAGAAGRARGVVAGLPRPKLPTMGAPKFTRAKIGVTPTGGRYSVKFEAEMRRLVELAEKSDRWRTGGYIGYLTGGMPNAYQGMENQQYYQNKGVEYRKRDAIKDSMPGFAAAAATLPVAIYASNKLSKADRPLSAVATRIGVPAAAVFGINALVGGKKQAVPAREKRLKEKQFSNREYDQLVSANTGKNVRRVEYIGSNISSYPLAAAAGAGLGFVGGGLLLGKRGFNKKSALIGAAGLLGVRAAQQPSINRWEDKALKKDDLLSEVGNDFGLNSVRNIVGLGGLAGAVGLFAGRKKILDASASLAKRFRGPGKFKVVPRNDSPNALNPAWKSVNPKLS